MFCGLPVCPLQHLRHRSNIFLLNLVFTTAIFTLCHVQKRISLEPREPTVHSFHCNMCRKDKRAISRPLLWAYCLCIVEVLVIFISSTPFHENFGPLDHGVPLGSLFADWVDHSTFGYVLMFVCLHSASLLLEHIILQKFHIKTALSSVQTSLLYDCIGWIKDSENVATCSTICRILGRHCLQWFVLIDAFWICFSLFNCI